MLELKQHESEYSEAEGYPVLATSSGVAASNRSNYHPRRFELPRTENGERFSSGPGILQELFSRLTLFEPVRGLEVLGYGFAQHGT